MAQGDGEEVAWLPKLVAGVRRVHDTIIQTSGGVLGEDTAKLSSACARPWQTSGGQFLHPTEIEWAAVLFHGLICGHPFTDGCKRTGVLMAAALLAAVGWVADFPTPEQIREMEGVALEAASVPNLAVSVIVVEFERIFGPNAKANEEWERTK